MIKRGPRKLSVESLERVGVLWNGSLFEMILQCVECNAVWSPDKLRGGGLPKGWWKCPRGCNE